MTNRPPAGLDEPLPPAPTEPGQTWEEAATAAATETPADEPTDTPQED